MDDRRQGRLLAAFGCLARSFFGDFPFQVAQPVALVFLAAALLFRRPPLPLGDPLGLDRGGGGPGRGPRRRVSRAAGRAMIRWT